MAHFIEKFSSVISGGACPVALDDIEGKVRYPLCESPAFNKGWASYFNLYMWVDYPESHHVE